MQTYPTSTAVASAALEKINALDPVTVIAYDSSSTQISMDVISTSITLSNGAGSQFSIGNCCSGEADVVCASMPAISIGDFVQLKWSCGLYTGHLFAGYLTKAIWSGGTVELTLRDIVYINGDEEYTSNSCATAYAILLRCSSIIGATGVETNTQALTTSVAMSDENCGDMTVSEVIGAVAMLCGANAFIDRTGKIALARYTAVDFSAECYESSEETERDAFAVSGLAMSYETTDEETGVMSRETLETGDGYWEFENSLATQSLVEYAYDQLTATWRGGSFSFAGGLLLDPGDIITLNNSRILQEQLLASGGALLDADGNELYCGQPTYQVACCDITIDIDGGVMCTVSSGASDDAGGSTGAISRALTETHELAVEAVNKVVAEADAREEAIANATELITGNQGGYVCTRIGSDGKPYEVLVMDTDDISTATKVWRWNQNGLGYSSSGYDGEYALAMTSDGAIVADFITTGTLTANILKAGVLEDVYGNFSLDLSTGTLVINADNMTTSYTDEDGNTVTQTIKGIDDSVSSLAETVQENADDIADLHQYLTYDSSTGLTIGRVDTSGETMKVVLSSDEMGFYQAGVKVAYINASRLYITEAEILDKLYLGSFAFIPRSNGNLSFRWVGD